MTWSPLLKAKRWHVTPSPNRAYPLSRHSRIQLRAPSATLQSAPHSRTARNKRRVQTARSPITVIARRSGTDTEQCWNPTASINTGSWRIIAPHTTQPPLLTCHSPRVARNLPPISHHTAAYTDTRHVSGCCHTWCPSDASSSPTTYSGDAFTPSLTDPSCDAKSLTASVSEPATGRRHAQTFASGTGTSSIVSATPATTTHTSIAQDLWARNQAMTSVKFVSSR